MDPPRAKFLAIWGPTASEVNKSILRFFPLLGYFYLKQSALHPDRIAIIDTRIYQVGRIPDPAPIRVHWIPARLRD